MATKTAGKSPAKTAKSKSKKAAPRRLKPRKASTSQAKAARTAGKPAAKAKSKATPKAAKAAAAKKPRAKTQAKSVEPTKHAAKKQAAAAKTSASKSGGKVASTAAKTSVKKPAKKAPAKEPAAKKTSPNSAPKKAAGKPPSTKSASKATAKKESVKKKPETAAKKKALVGQKPRSPKASESADFLVPQHVQKATSSVNEAPVKASPASAEAKLDFKVNDSIVYPAHGVGKIVGIEKQTIAGVTNELFLIVFEQEKMKLRVPTAKAKAVGMRALSDPALVKKAVETLKGRARIKRTMWSRRAQEYEAKINSGDIISVAEVVRDLYRASDQPEQSYSERQLFEAALDRLAREVAAVNKTDLAAAIETLEASLQQKKAA